MTIAELRKQFPHSEFFFFENGKQMMKAPFYHARIKSYDIINENKIFIEV